MRSIQFTMIAVALGACGASTPKHTETVEAPAPAPEPPAEKPPEPPPPRQWYAKVALTPVKGAKLKPTIVSFSQREGGETSLTADAFSGAKPGTYWLVVHASDTCGPNATKAGPAWETGTPFKVVIAKDLSISLEPTVASFDLDGDASAVGHTLALHDDKKGAPGKAVACGAIETVEEP